MRTPKLSIGMPVYNGEKYLREAIRSLLEQDFTDFELIIGDNASSDGTMEIVREAAATDARVRYYRNETNIGASANFERVFKLGRGEYFKWACADDMHYPGNLRRSVEVLAAAPPEVALVVPRISLIDERGRSLLDAEGFALPESGLGRDNVPERLSTRAKTPHRRLAEILPRFRWATSMYGIYRRSALALTRKIDSFYASDRVLLAEIAMLGEIIEIDEFLFASRYHAGISTLRNKTSSESVLWFDPAANGSALKRRILFLEYARSVKALPLTSVEKLLCFGVVARTWFTQKIQKLRKRYARSLCPGLAAKPLS